MKNAIKIPIDFIPSKNNDEECVMHLKLDSIEIIINDRADKVAEKVFDSLIKK